MPGPRRRPIALAAGLLTLLLAVPFQPASAAPTGSDGTVSSAAAKKPAAPKKKDTRPASSTSLTVAAQLYSGTRTTLRGRTTAPSKKVTLQRLAGKKWVTVATAKVSGKGAFSFTLAARTGATRYRVSRPADTRRKASLSPVRTMTGHSCPTAAKPGSPTAVWYTDPTRRKTSEIATGLASYICAAAPGAQVRIAMFFASPLDSDPQTVLRAAAAARAVRGVRTTLLVDSTWTNSAQRKWIASYGVTVVSCKGSCLGTSDGVQHAKFITISDMSWSKAKDPVAIISSMNLSQRQLRQYWQDAYVFHGDPTLVAGLDRQWRGFTSCTTRSATSCKSWKSAHLARRTLQGRAGSGLTVSFTPVTAGTDHTLEFLRRHTCASTGNGARNTLWVSMFMISGDRGGELIKELRRLQLTGCTVRVVTSVTENGVANATDAARARMDRYQLGYRCVQLMHYKSILLDASDLSGRRVQALHAGSQNMTTSGHARNDEVSMELSLGRASGLQRTAAAAILKRQESQWNRLWNTRSRSCGTSAVVAAKGSPLELHAEAR